VSPSIIEAFSTEAISLGDVAGILYGTDDPTVIVLGDTSNIPVGSFYIQVGTVNKLWQRTSSLGGLNDYVSFTKETVVPNIPPLVGQILIGKPGGGSYLPESIDGDGILSSTGTLTIHTIGGVDIGPEISSLQSSVGDLNNAVSQIQNTLVNTIYEKILSMPGKLVSMVGTMRWYPGVNINISDVFVSVGTTSKNKAILVDLKKNGISILFSLISIPANVNVSGITVPAITTAGPSDYFTVDIVDPGTNAYDLNLRVRYLIV
jgi:hypothetical protein